MNSEIGVEMIRAFNEAYFGLVVLNAVQVHGSIIMIDFGSNNTRSLTITASLAYWVLEDINDAILTSEEPFSNTEIYREALGRIIGLSLCKIGFDDDELEISFSDGFRLVIIEDLDSYNAEEEVVTLNGVHHPKFLCYSPHRDWFYSN